VRYKWWLDPRACAGWAGGGGVPSAAAEPSKQCGYQRERSVGVIGGGGGDGGEGAGHGQDQPTVWPTADSVTGLAREGGGEGCVWWWGLGGGG
jgi:hypothetical protein